MSRRSTRRVLHALKHPNKKMDDAEYEKRKQKRRRQKEARKKNWRKK